MKTFLRRYKLFLLLLAVNLIVGILNPTFGASSFQITKDNIMEMLSVLPPIFVLLGLLDVWVEKEVMMRYLGKDSGFKGMIMAFGLGAVAAGPLYAAFPVATVMLKKGSGLFNVFIFIGAWSTAKIPLLTFEASSLGFGFMLVRLIINIFGIIAIAYVTRKTLSEQEKKEVYHLAEDA